MSIFYISREYSNESKRQTIKELLEATTPDRDFYLLVIGSIILALCGILSDNITVLIASMIVAPLMFPILSLSLALVVSDNRLFVQSLIMLIFSVILAILIGGVFSLLVKSYFVIGERVLISFFPNIFFDVLIAVVSGIIATYGLIRPKVGAAMTGIGIGVSLMPPLVALGIGLFDPITDLATRAGTIFLLNFFGILTGSIITFIMFNMRHEYHVVKNNLK